MRFAIPFTANNRSRMSRYIKDWPLAMRFGLLVLPAGVCVALLAAWVGYRSAAGTLHEALEAVPLLEAKTQAHAMGDTLEQLRQNLLTVARDGELAAHPLNGAGALREVDDGIAKSFREAVERKDDEAGRMLREIIAQRFQNNLPLVQELGFKNAEGEGFLLLREADGFRVVDAAEAGQGPYSPFQQIASLPLIPGEATLFPPVYDDSLAGAPDGGGRTPVMRMAYQAPGGSCVVVLGINLAEWEHRLSRFVGPESPLRMARQEGASQLSFFFDQRGWILFEMDSASNGSFLPDVAREGYSGDLGRPGYDAAFRPWAMHRNYWFMVTEAAAGRSGSVPAPADKYMVANAGSTGFLCYAPVFFSPGEGRDPQVVGGIAFFETSVLPLGAFLRFANASVMVAVASLLLFALLAWRVERKLARPLQRMSESLVLMAEDGEPAFLDEDPACEEQQKLQAAVNTIIAGALTTKKDLQRLEQEVRHTRSRRPAALAPVSACFPPESEYGLVGSSAAMREVREHVRKAARAGTDVLVWGETGTGKELVAAAIHKAGSRNAGPYISINCGALDENLLLDALFGHVKGAFTEAATDRKGAFLSAEGGTLHLDEIGNASPKVQQALLRALSVRRIRPLGTDEEVPFSTRVVAATNEDLRARVKDGSFREDLYYRLAIISIETPPLRHRKEDIPELAAYCLHESAQSLDRSDMLLAQGALDVMLAYDWPGNVRELKNRLMRAMAFAEGELILPEHIVLEAERPAPPEGLRAVSEAAAADEAAPAPAESAPLRNAGDDESPAAPASNEAAAPAELYGAGLNERQVQALELVGKTGQISRARYEEVAGRDVSSRTAQTDLRELVEKGFLERVGSGRNVRYVPGPKMPSRRQT